MDIIKIIDLFKSNLSWGIIAFLLIIIICILRVIFDEDRTDIFRAWVFKCIFAVSGKIEQEKQYISNDIKGRLNLARRKMHFGKSILPKAIDVVWVPNEKGNTFDIKEGEFIVRLDPSNSQTENISILATAIVKRTTLQGIRHSVEEPLQQAIDLNMTRNLLRELNNKMAIDWFFQNIYTPIIKNSEETKKRNEQIIIMDERGLFTRLFLVELDLFSKEMHGREPKLYMTGEIEGLVEFIVNISKKQIGVEVPLTYSRAFIRLGVIIVAKTDKLLESIEPYIKVIDKEIKIKLNSIYVVVFDKKYLEGIDQGLYRDWEKQLDKLDNKIERLNKLNKDFDEKYICIDYFGKRRKARIIRYSLAEELKYPC